MTASPLANALLACAAGIYTHEAGVGLLVANRVFLDRDDFTSRFITRDTATRMAVIDWAAAITALDAGEIPCSGGEQRTLRLAASIAGGTPVNLSDTLTGLDDRSIQQLITAIRQASGKAQKTGLILVQRRTRSLSSRWELPLPCPSWR
jgi:ABC-type cobalamin/Fe3+-siderophores transport system ATPase subunit